MTRRSLLGVPPVLLAVLAWNGRAVIDDSFINFRIVDNILAGAGVVYNVGERVEASTSTLWLAVLTLAAAPFRAVGIDLPWTSVLLGIASTVGGVWLAQVGSARLSVGPRDRAAFLVPAGSLVCVAVPPFWEFAASGMDTGLAILWIGASVWALACRARRREAAPPLWPAVLIGLGVTIRPDLGVMVVALAAGLLWIEWPHRRHIGLMLALVAVPGLVQLWRMGYYASMVPNTALSKEAFGARWAQGGTYFLDLAATYWLAVPMAPLMVALAALVRRRASRAVALAALVGGAAHALYVIRLGGDYMHARMLLPSLFVVLAPVAAWPIWGARVAVRRGGLALTASLVTWSLIVAWAAVSGTSLRVPYAGDMGEALIGDEVSTWRRHARHPNPVTVEEYANNPSTIIGHRLRARAEAGARELVFDDEGWQLRPDWPATIVTDGLNLGVFGYVAGRRVHIADQIGLTEPIGARLELTARSRPGHEKVVPRDWLVARFAAQPIAADLLARFPGAADALVALQCSPLRDIVAATHDPLTPRRFLQNLASAPSFTVLRIPMDPARARQRFCGERSLVPRRSFPGAP